MTQIIELAQQGPFNPNPFNPEAVAIIVNAATAAQYNAQVAAVMAILSFCVLLIIGAVIGWMVYQFTDLKHQTNSIMDRLLAVTSEEALARGVLQGHKEEKEKT